MIKDHIDEIRNDLKSKRDALLIGHQNLKKDSPEERVTKVSTVSAGTLVTHGEITQLA